MMPLLQIGMWMRAGMVALLLAMPVSPAFAAVQPDEILSDPVLEERARDLSLGLRCLVCQNQSIDDSNAPLARDLRILVRERLVAGDSDEEVIAFVVSRYGEYVLLSPRLKTSTLVLWGAPAAFVLLGGLLAMLLFRRNRGHHKALVPLDAKEKARIAALLKDNAE